MAETKKVVEDNPEPELTLRSGLALGGASLTYFSTVGFLNAYGVFQDFYTQDFLRQDTNFKISWLGSFATFSLFAFAAPAGILSDKFGPRIPMIVGSVCQLLALFMISLCKKYYQFFLAQGVLLGIGMSLLTIPAAGICPRYFKRNRGIASGISVAGSSLGGVLWPVACDQLLHKDGISFAWAIRTIGFCMIPMHIIAILLVRLPLQPKKAIEDGIGEEKSAGKSARPKPDRSGLKKPAFLLLCLGLFFAFFGFFTPFFFASTYAASLGMSQSLAFYLVSIINGASMFGRILPGFLADRWGRFNMLTASALLGGVIAFCWTTATSIAGIVVWCAAYGFSSGAILSLQLACSTMLVHESASSTAVGVVMGSTSLAGLFGGPIAGELVKHGYLAASCWAGATLIIGSALTFCARLCENRALLARV